MTKSTAKRPGPGKILIGTASWSDPGFVERWYPKGMTAVERLPWYAQHFEMVEVNSTFYAVPEARMVERWCRSTPDKFIFDVKLHQLLSRHSTAAKMLPTKLRDRAERDAKGKVALSPEIEAALVEEILRAIAPLRAAGKLGSLLLQLSPAFSPRRHQLDELRPLLDLLADYRVAVEFRNRNWAEGEHLAEMLTFLRAHAAALVSVDTPAQKHFTIMPPELDEVTDRRVAYLRLHGRDAHAYTTGKTVATRFNYDYRDDEIAEVAERSRKLAQRAQEVHVVFNNNALDYAPHAALRLRAALGQITRAPVREAELF
ncbi:MAG TPA: DUF72 domain-containing protein [Chthoniobacterales bacterium]|nr:DUF72 domain-containing protein [Chthoniobacterales bacterium]